MMARGLRNLPLYLALALAPAGCARVSTQMQRSILEGQRQYNSGNYMAAQRLLSRALAAEGDSPAAAEAYYIRGLCYLKQGNTARAKADLLKALEKANRKDLEADVLICLGAIAYEKGDWGGACKYWIRAEDQLPNVAPNDTLLYRLAVALQRQGRWDEARK